MGNADSKFLKFDLAIFQHQVKGLVTDSNGIPIQGVNVGVKNTAHGTFTNNEGVFTIDAGPTDVLTFSYIGFKTKEIPLGDDLEVTVVLEEDITNLGEVTVNAGYYTVSERERTGNIAKVTAEEIELQPVLSPIQALQGRMAGVEVIPGGNQPGMASTIRIRGQNSLRDEGNYPLYIIDGVPVNSAPVESNSLLGSTGIDPLNTLNLSNIESIEVLKDADATAIYGSRGANGIILITTKKGRQEKTAIEARIYTGMATLPNRIDLLTTEQYLQIRRKAFENDGIQPNESNAPDLKLWDQNRYTDWQDYFFGGTSPITDVNLAVSGGNENTSFRLGGSYHTQGSIYPGDYDYNKVTAGLNLNHTSDNKKLGIDLSVNYGVDTNNLVGAVNLSSSIFGIPPNAPPIFNDDGSLHWEEWSMARLSNPLQGYFNTSTTTINNLVSNLGISYEVLSGLSIKTNMGYTYYNSDELMKLPRRSYNPAWWTFLDHRSLHLKSERKSWIIEPQLVYNKQIGKGRIEAILGGTFQERAANSIGMEAIGYIDESLIGNLSAAERLDNGTSRDTEYRYSAVFARLGYNWDRKYYINLTGRRDGSSRFASGNRFANFGAIGTAWIFSEEPFIKRHLPFLSFGKFRGSYGTTGNDQIPDYGYLDAYEATRGPGGLYPTQLYNPDYSWEVNKKLEAAVELGFLKDRINVGASWYRNRSSNQLVGLSLPGTTGFASVQANLPATVENKGWEIELSTLNVSNGNFQWQTSFNITFPKNRLLSYPNIEQSPYANVYRVGHPLNIDLLYRYEGIDPVTGLYSIADINGDDRLDYLDRVVIKDVDRKFYGGINNQLNFKDFSVQFLWEFVKQEGKIGSLFDAGQMRNQRAEVLQALEDGSEFQRISTQIEALIANSNVINTTFPYEDASFLRLKTLSIGYLLPADIMETVGVNTCKLFLTGQNLITITGYTGMDPETPGLGTSFAGLRTISLGVEVKF
ncbi:SusC/RagA family TonB-linked outer membrane protein [Galbibacter sp. BG1]|uniref:SusC/RagA family TonB-linked outer membrane protein n=1 Tax=Galbibacter sp. BG1 TaxID=1170699 RepID=UPI0021044899|nr:SusC/RagA family TonB-linked outer membrane protein [Galbibacter sp. BG1]